MPLYLETYQWSPSAELVKQFGTSWRPPAPVAAAKQNMAVVRIAYYERWL